MINKQNMWFLTLFSLVLVLSVYYVTMPSELLITNNSNEISSLDSTEPTVSIEESSKIDVLQVEYDSEVQETLNELKETLTNMEISVDERNAAYEQIRNINKVSGQEETLEKMLSDKYGYEVFVKINGNQIRVVVGNKDGTVDLANEIMRLEKKCIFQSNSPFNLGK